MARADPRNRSRIWTDPDVHGLLMMHAGFTTHEFAPHVHDELVIALTERGGSEFRSRGIYDHAEPGSVLVFNPGEPHSGRMAGSAGWRYRSFYLSRSNLATLAEQIGVDPRTMPHFLANKVRDPRLLQELTRLHMLSERSASLLEKQTALLGSLATLFQRHGAPGPKLGDPGTERSVVANALQYLNDRYHDNISLADLAALADMSAYHLIRCFNKEVGLSPHAYLTQIRIRRARTLLEEGVPAAEIAVAVGLYDQSALSRHFKRIYGVTPGQYGAAIRYA